MNIIVKRGTWLVPLGEADLDKLVSVREAAQKLGGISPWTVWGWLSQGRITRIKVGSRTMVYESELAKVINVGGKSRVPRAKKT